MASMIGGGKLMARLQAISGKTDGLPTVSVGFLKGATYPLTGIGVAEVAGVNEFGNPANNQPPRPFFRRMVAEKKSTWGNAVALQLKETDYDIPKTLDRVGQGIKSQLQESIRNLTDPPLSPVTVKRKGFAKPLVDTGQMLNSVDYRVDE